LNPAERLYIAALTQRYSMVAPEKIEEFSGLCSSFSLVSGETAINYFQIAIQLQDAIYSADPPPWYFPVPQLLGVALLQYARPAEAKHVFQQDLIIYPHNGWSLYGLMQSHLALGEQAAAHDVQKQLSAAWQYADIKKPVYPL
jgi:tetratricopeptide (TPR) repeat protein